METVEQLAEEIIEQSVHGASVSDIMQLISDFISSQKIIYIVIKQVQSGTWEIDIDTTYIQAYKTVEEACLKVDELYKTEESHKVNYTYIEVPFS